MALVIRPRLPDLILKIISNSLAFGFGVLYIWWCIDGHLLGNYEI
jgi:hypothetical protein